MDEAKEVEGGNGNVKKKGKTVSFLIKEKEIEKSNENVKMHGLSILDLKPSRILGFPLTVKQQIWFVFLLPSITLLIIYVMDIATDIAVGLSLMNERKYFQGGITLLLVYLPPFIFYIIRLCSPPDTKELKVALAWFSIETLAFVLFPIRPLQCIAERIFWSVEALRLKDPEREEALEEYEGTKVGIVENYFFLQAFVQAAPQAIYQIIFLAKKTSHYRSTELVQSISVLSSIATLALITSSYQRYEAQVRGGRQEVWTSSDRSLSTLLESVEHENEQQAPPQQRRRWTKVMDEDDPLGRIMSFTFWYIFLFGRILSLVTASLFFPWTVLAICAAHYLFSFIYILPSPDCTTAIPAKIALALVYIFCLVEVRVQFRKSVILYTLFFILSYVEDVCLTLLWVFLKKWKSDWYHFSLYLIIITHIAALIFLTVYFKFFKPRVQRLGPL